MLDGRRHSVDLPLSRTLVALRRVRSLRDPSTNSITKSSAFVDNLTWDAASCYGISLELGNDHQGQEDDGLSNHSPLRSRSFGLEERNEEFASDPELESSTRKTTYKSKKLSSRIGKRGPNSMRPKHIEDSIYDKTSGGGVYGDKSFSQRHDSDHDRALDMICVQPPVDNSIRSKHFEDSAYSRVNGAGIYGDKSYSQRHDTDHERAMDLICVQPSDNHLEDFDSYSEPTLGSARYEKVASIVRKRKSAGCRKQMKPSRVVGDAGSEASSPYPSLSDGRLDGSSLSLSMFANEELDLEDPNHRGCGISCCWSRTPRYRESDLPSDGEDNPLLSGEVAEMGLSEQELSCTYVKSETAPYSDSPRSLSHKFRPKFFSELVGQHVVARSLLNAISRGKLTSFYLFHGPRGTGKTSAARIFAAALNCLSLQEHGPCGSCRECILFFSGRNRDVKEVDPAKTNRTDRVRSLLKDAARPPVSSRYKAFIIDECQLLRGETWTTVLSSIDVLPRHVVFVMITADLDNLPRSALSRCQRYHFPKINDVDIVGRLTKICVEEGLDFDEAALGFIAAKSSGSLRDAEMMLDQLSLLGKKVTVSSAHELIGIVSDDELLDLLDLAFSSDTSRTVRRARDLMRSRVDPMQLISQLANLIMDMLSGRWQTGSSEAGRNFFRNTSEMDLQKLKHALKILSDAEKQLRTSKNQTTWLTVALLQLSSVESFPLDGNDSRVFPGTEQPRDDSFCGACLSGQSVSCSCHDNKSQSSEIHPDSKGKLEIIWRRALEKCQSNTLRSFLQKEGKLSSVCVNQGLAVAEVEFRRPDYVSKAEKSWKLIANSLQIVLGCNVEIRLGLVPSAYSTKNSKVNKPSCGLLSCSRRMHSTSEDDHSDSSDFTSRRSMERGRPVETCSSDPGPHISPVCSHRKEASTTIRNSEGNALSTGTTVSLRSAQDDPLIVSQMRFDCSKEELENQECESQPSCFSKTLRLQRFQRRSRSSSSDASQAICLRIQPRNKLELSVPHKAALESYFCANDPYILCPNSNTVSNISVDEARPENETVKDPKVHCWRTPKIPLRKAWQLRPQHERSSPLVGWLLPCATAK